MRAQATSTASRRADAQLGVGFTTAKPDYVPQRYNGFALYGDLDLTPHLGIEAEFHQTGTSSAFHSSERTFEIGGRYLHAFGPAVPYAKLLAGRGVFSYPQGLTSVSYEMVAAGAGADIKAGPHLRLRVDYEFQRWSSFPTGGLSPQLFTVGAAYHFTGRPRYR